MVPSLKSAVRQQTQVRLEEFKGVLWPCDVYKRVKNVKTIPKELSVTTMMVNGRKIRGVVLDESHGRPVGSVCIYSEDTKYVTKAGLVWFLQVSFGFHFALSISSWA